MRPLKDDALDKNIGTTILKNISDSIILTTSADHITDSRSLLSNIAL